LHDLVIAACQEVEAVLIPYLQQFSICWQGALGCQSKSIETLVRFSLVYFLKKKMHGLL
jgi:hypothetical protein